MKDPSSGLDPRIEAIASHIGRRLADAAVEDMRARYDFGRILNTVRSRGRGADGAGALRLLAKRLRVDTSALRRFAQVSDVIPPGEFQWMMRLRTPLGAPLTWSHVELLARVRTSEKRRALASAVVEEELSVRALFKRFGAHR